MEGTQKEAWLCDRNQITKLDEKMSSEKELTTEFDLEHSDFVRCGVNKTTQNKPRHFLY